jgi:hypothetical protein
VGKTLKAIAGFEKIQKCGGRPFRFQKQQILILGRIAAVSKTSRSALVLKQALCFGGSAAAGAPQNENCWVQKRLFPRML